MGPSSDSMFERIYDIPQRATRAFLNYARTVSGSACLMFNSREAVEVSPKRRKCKGKVPHTFESSTRMSYKGCIPISYHRATK